jgi:hypothetical protein
MLRIEDYKNYIVNLSRLELCHRLIPMLSKYTSSTLDDGLIKSEEKQDDECVAVRLPTGGPQSLYKPRPGGKTLPGLLKTRLPDGPNGPDG